MAEYLQDSKRNIIGVLEEVREKRILYTEKGHDVLGYFDVNKNATYDAYGNCIGEGDMLQDLPYFPHRLRFPLPEPSRVKFSTYSLPVCAEAKNRKYTEGYWDNGKCQICGKHGNTCHVQGLPGMCEVCYRMLFLYSKNDSLGLEKKSCRTPIEISTWKKAVNMAKAPFIAASEAADAAAKAAVWNAGKEALKALAGDSGKANVQAGAARPVSSAMAHPQYKRQQAGKKSGKFPWGRVLGIVLLLGSLTFFLLLLCSMIALYQGVI